MNGGAAPPPQTVYQKAPPQTTYQKEIVNAGAPALYHMNGGTTAPPPQTVYRKEPVRQESPPPQRRTVTQNPQTTYQKEIVNAGAPTLYHMNGGTTAPPPQTVYRKEPVREESPPPQRRTVTQNPRTLQNDVQYPSNTAPTLYHMNGGSTAPLPTVYQKAPPQTVYKKELLTADAPTLYHMNGAPPQTVYQKEIVRDTPQPRYVAETPQPTRSRAQTPPRRQNNPNTQNTERPYVIQPANSYTPQPPPKVNMYHLDEPNDVVRYTPVNPPSSRVNPQQEPYRKQQQPLETVKPKQTTEPDLTVVRRVYKKLPPTDDEQIPNENYAQPVRKVQQTPREYTASPQLTNRQIINPIPNQNPSIYYIQNTNAY
ncbi:unnamed protein product [Adineta steineri]|nr:unnamed protein product [Adineta steineri]